MDIDSFDSFVEVKKLMASLAILGGHGDRLRPGCRVQLKISEEDDDAMAEKGICISANRSSGLCQVLFDNVKRPVTIEISKVISMSEMDALGAIPIDETLLQHLSIFTEPVFFESRDPSKNGDDEKQDTQTDTISTEVMTETTED